MSLIARILAVARTRLAGRTKLTATLYYGGFSLICQVLRFGGVILATRAIESVQFGLFAKATLILSIAGLVREIGQSAGIVAYQGQDRRYVLYNFQLNVLLGFAAACLTTASALFPSIVAPEIRPYTWMLGATIMFEALTLTNTWMLQKQFRFRFLGIVDVISLIAWVATLASLAGRMPGLLVLLWAQLAEAITRCVLLFAKTRLSYVGLASGADLRQYYFVQFARPSIPQVVILGILARSDYILLSWLRSTHELGIYERVMQFARIPISLSINLCDKVLLQSYSHAQRDPAALWRLVRQATVFVAVAVTIVIAATSAGLLLFLNRLVGAEWSPVILALWWFSIPVTLMTPMVWNINLLFTGIGIQSQNLRTMTVMFIAEFAVGLPLVFWFGVRGMLLARALSSAVVLVYQFIVVRGRFAPAKIAPTLN